MSSLNHNIAKNALWIIACRIAQAVLSLAISTLSARYLGPDHYGLLHYAISVVAFVSPIALLGLSATLVQELLKKPQQEGETLGSALAISLFSSLLCMAGTTAFIYLSNPKDTVCVIVCTLYSTMLLGQALELMQYWFQAKLLSKYTSVTALISYGFVSAYKIFLLATGKSIYWFAVSYALDYLLIGILLLILYRKKGGQPLSFSWQRAKELVSGSKHYILSLTMVAIFAQTDRIMLKWMRGTSETGFYSAASTCATMTYFVFVALLDSYRPVILAGKQSGEDAFKKPMRQLYSLLIYLSAAQALLFPLIAKPLVNFLYGNAYAAAAPALLVLIWCPVVSYIGTARDIWILANSRQNLLWIVNISGAALNIAANYLLIPHYGATGAAMASLISQFFANVVLGFFLAPLKPNQSLMLESLNPKIFIDTVGNFRK